MKKYNVVIIGAGPAGSFLAYKLGKHGYSVLILEKENFPRYKICAGGLSKKSYDILFSENKDIRSIIEKKVKKILFVRNKKLTFTDAKKDLIYMIYRSKLDDYLIKMALKNKSVRFNDNISINTINQDDSTIIYRERNTEQKINYDILIGAWGSNRQLNRLIDIFPFESYAVSSTWEGAAGPIFAKYSDEYAVCQILKGHPGIVSYIFPKSGMITAGIFTSLNSIKNLKKMWNEFMDFWKLDKKIKPKYALIPIRNYNKTIARDNILLVGDAGGLADPFTGEGIYYAFVSSMIACKNIHNHFKNKNYDLACEYNKDIFQNLYDLHKWGKIYEFSFQHLPNISFWFGSEFHIGNEILNSFITGETKYYEISKIAKYFFKRNLS